MIVIVIWIIVLIGMECTQDSACGEGFYCGVDNACHEHRTIEKTIVENRFDRGAYIIGVIILRVGKKRS